MSQTLNNFRKNSKKITFNIFYILRQFSRRSVNSDGSYKTIKSTKKEEKGKGKDNNLAWRDPNFDLLASRTFPFMLRGEIGPAWYDTHTTLRDDCFPVNALQSITEKSDINIFMHSQMCPRVLRQTVYDLFPLRNLENSDLSVITVTLKPFDISVLKRNTEIETEKLAQKFVLTAKKLCLKLRKAGYWADFINPFSGRPYFAASMNSDELYTTDEKFRCIDFQIFEIKDCLIVSNEEEKAKRAFIGNLFTNAPSKMNFYKFFK